jgi:hypothetical protein
MRTKLLSVAVAMMLAVSAGGIVAATGASPDAVQTDNHPTVSESNAHDKRLTADESFSTQLPQENITVVGTPTRLTANQSFEKDVSNENITVVGETPRLTADQSFQKHVSSENVSVEEQYDEKLHVNESIQMDIPADAIETRDGTTYYVDLTDDQ